MLKRIWSKQFIIIKLAVERGSAVAYSNIGFMYDKGEGVTQSYEKAFQYFKLLLIKVLKRLNLI